MAWQYCDQCDASIDPGTEDFLVGTMDCSCGSTVEIICAEDTRIEILKQMYRDIEELKAVVLK